MTPDDDDLFDGPDDEDEDDPCPECGAHFDEEHDWDCSYYGDFDDVDD